MEDLFPIKPPGTPKARRRRQGSTRRWRDLLPMRKTTLGVPYTDDERAERMRVALVGVHMDKQAGHFMDLLTRYLAEGRMSMRVIALREVAPERVQGAAHLSCRGQQQVRATVARGEDRGYHAYLPFKVRMHKELPSGALAHGCLLLDDRGFDLALVPGGTHRATAAEWPVVEDRSWIPGAPQRGCVLVVGDSDARSSWSHLAERGALAVWPTGSKLMYVFKLLPGQHFPTPFDLAELRRRAAGESS